MAGAAPASAHAATTRCAGARLLPDAATARAVKAATLCLINDVRASHDLRPLRANRELEAVAASQLSAMVRWNYFADIRPSGQTPLSLISTTRYASHAAGLSVGEDIAWGSGARATPASIVAAWMADPPHRELILARDYRDAGVAASARVPSALHVGPPAAVYALELGGRRF